MSTPDSPASIRDFMRPEYTAPPSRTWSVEDIANCITAVYVKLDIFDPEKAEKAPELIASQIEQLHEKISANHKEYPIGMTEPFVVVNFTRLGGLAKLVDNFREEFHTPVRYDWELDEWDGIVDINRRRLDDGPEPEFGEVRVLDPSPSNRRKEPGLFVGGRGYSGKTVAKTREYAKNLGTLINAADFIGLQAMRMERGLPLLGSTSDTTTSFPQMRLGLGGSRGDSEARFIVDSEMRFRLGPDGAYPDVGVRRSVGL
ncbi:hypothetical protein CSA80_00120 [Candidatus Saccharibacteria bacterium]|nr:MAG: hypothetical protein CSA80_00120 [Candidatus Saccharibacteria bacterium]